MSILTYTKSATAIYEGLDWNSYNSLTNKSTLIFFTLNNIIKDNKYTDFDTLLNVLKTYYKTKTEKSSCVISNYEGRIEIRKVNKCLPEIWIVKNK